MSCDRISFNQLCSKTCESRDVRSVIVIRDLSSFLLDSSTRLAISNDSDNYSAPDSGAGIVINVSVCVCVCVCVCHSVCLPVREHMFSSLPVFIFYVCSNVYFTFSTIAMSLLLSHDLHVRLLGLHVVK